MDPKIKVKICDSHLAALFEAIKKNDTFGVESIEHVLTTSEECVACAYLLKADEPVASILGRFLQQEGFLVAVPAHETILTHVFFWLFRISLFASSILVAFGIEAIVRQIVFGAYGFGWPSLTSLGVIEMIAVGVISLLIFLIIDDKFID